MVRADVEADLEEVDVVVVGSGSSGCAAALACHDKGFKTILLEKGASLGGGTAYSSGGIWIPANHLQLEAGIADTPEEGIQYLEFLGAGYHVDANLRSYVERGPAALKYFAGLGLGFHVIRGVPDIYHGLAPGAKKEGRMVEIDLFPAGELGEWRDKVLTSPFTLTRATFDEAIRWGGRGSYRGWDPAVQAERERSDMRALGAGLVAAFVKALLVRNIPILLETAAQRLVASDGRVTALVVQVAGRDRHIRVNRGVILATGGYEANPELVRSFEDIPGLRNMFPDTLTGDGLVMGAEIGAQVRVIPRLLTVFLGYDIPARDGRPALFRNAGTSEIPQPHSIIVNKSGRRFGDEAFFQKLQNGLRAFDVPSHTYPNLPCFWVFDSQYTEKYSFGGLPIGVVPDYVVRGDTFEELASGLGVDARGLSEEVARFNRFVGAGTDQDFGRGGESWSRSYSGDLTSSNPNLGTLQKPPFYGIRLHPSGVSSAGLLTNEIGQVLNQRGRPIEGLYALANCSAGVEYGVGYQAGLTLGKGMIFAYTAARHLHRGA